MSERPSKAPASKRAERRLHCKRREQVEFPVPAEHDLARFQTLTPVRSAEDVQDFLGAWAKVAEGRDQAPPSALELAAQLKKQKVSVLRVAVDSLRIPDRAVVTLNNPLNHIECDEVTIAGDLVVHGDLVLRCNTLTIE
jgi:hypothetical protein